MKCKFCGSTEAECFDKCLCAKCLDPKGYEKWKWKHPDEYQDWIWRQLEEEGAG